MLTLFTAPKPFVGHIGVIQRNALRSWMRLAPGAEILVFGDEPGTPGVCRDLGLAQIADVARNEFGTPLINDIFTKASRLARHDWLCYSNCDILLPPALLSLFAAATARFPQFVLAGRRWDLDVTEPINFSDEQWCQRIQGQALRAKGQRPAWWIDFFAFRGDFFRNLPPFAIGRPAWDNWFLANALAQRVPVIDVSSAMMAVHQNHDYRHHSAGQKGVFAGAEAVRNRALAVRPAKLSTINAATHEVTATGEFRSRTEWQQFIAPIEFFWIRRISPVLYKLLDRSLRVRDLFGLRRNGWLGAVLRQRNS